VWAKSNTDVDRYQFTSPVAIRTTSTTSLSFPGVTFIARNQPFLRAEADYNIHGLKSPPSHVGEDTSVKSDAGLDGFGAGACSNPGDATRAFRPDETEHREAGPIHFVGEFYVAERKAA
jgi:hypothetical protein